MQQMFFCLGRWDSYLGLYLGLWDWIESIGEVGFLAGVPDLLLRPELQRELCLCLESPELSPVAAPLLSLFPCFLNTPGIVLTVESLVGCLCICNANHSTGVNPIVK